MTHRELPHDIRGLCLLAGLLLAGLLPATDLSAAKRPNIVIIYADDMGFGDLGVQNADSKIPTPHLDRLAREGIRFTDAHSSSGICTPSRYALLTGRYHWRKFHSIVGAFGPSVFDPARLTLPEMLQEKGYRTACIGKWHLGWDWNAIRRPNATPRKAGKKNAYGADAFDWSQPIPDGPLAHGFDYYFGDDVPNFPPYTWIENDRVLAPPTVPYVPDPKPAEGAPEGRPGPMVEGWKQDQVMPQLTERAVAWIGEQAAGERPFFLYFPWTSPHAPIVPTAEFQGKTEAGGYGDFVMQSDWSAGQVLAALDEHGLRENTLVIFTADNGPEKYAYDRIRNFQHRSAGPLRGLKRDIWEGGHRVPFLARWPGVIEAGRASDALVSQIDLMATIAAIVDYRLPEGSAEDSHDLLPLLKGAGASPRRSHVHNTRADHFAIRQDEWVLVDAKSGGISAVPRWFDEQNGYTKNTHAGALYDLHQDIGQRKNQIAERPDKVRQLQALLRQTRQRGEVRREDRAAAAERPNILFIMSDDHCAQAVGAYGGRLAGLNPTPTIDTLAREGMLLENCFVTNSICTPSRASILTGQYSHVNGVLTLNGRIEPARQVLALEMKKAGYLTAMIGKWHLKEEPAAFDYYKVLPGQGKYHNPEFRVQGEKPWPKNVVKHEGQHSSDAITDSTLAWLKERDKSQPFFLMHHYKAPHDMFDNARRYDSYLEEADIPEPASLWSQPHFGSIATRGADDELLPYIGTSIGRRNPRRNYTKLWAKDPGLSDEEAQRLAYQAYLKRFLRCVKGVDDNLARLFAQLKKEGIYDNTLVIYTGDQGFMLGEHDYMDKRWMYDESQRMPFLVRYPRAIEAGSRSDAIVENVDFAATMLDFAGAEAPSSMQGQSFRQVLETGREPAGWKQAAYYRYWMHLAHHDNPAHFGIRTKKHKLIFYYGSDTEGKNRTPPGWELYDLVKDPSEVRNVYDDRAYASVRDELKKQLAARRREIGDEEQEFPAIGAIVDEFWDYDEADRAQAVEISHAWLAAKQRQADAPKPAGKKPRGTGKKGAKPGSN